MRTRQMKYLLTISRTGSMSKAADDLGMSSQALGEAVRSLEEELGTRLLERSYRGTLLTEAGNAFAEVSDVYFSNLEKIHQKYKQTQQEMKPVECMVMPHIASMVMPKLISGLYKARSDIRINMKEEPEVTKIYQAVVNQTIAGLAQGRQIRGKVLFLGGPLFFFKGLQQRFEQTLRLAPGKAVFPEWAQYSVALGAAIYTRGLQTT